MIRRWLKNLLALFIGLLLALLLAEIVLRIHNPFSRRIRGSEIVLPAKQQYRFENVHLRGLDPEIVHTKNSLGFRGPELPEDEGVTRIFCVGGSTTECFYLNDGTDWPAVMAEELRRLKPTRRFVVNNAGLDGHSTRGHEVLLRDHLLKLKPDYIIFLVGCNDLAAGDFSRFEAENLVSNMRFLQRFEIFNLYLQMRLARAAGKRGLGHQEVDLKTWPVADTTGWQQAAADPEVLKAYEKRLANLAKMTTDAGAVPVFVTQPVLLGGFTDSLSGRYLGNCAYQGQSGLHYRKRLNMINEVTIRFCRKQQFACIRADEQLPSSSAYYYDFFHYTRAGGARMGGLIARGFSPLW